MNVKKLVLVSEHNLSWCYAHTPNHLPDKRKFIHSDSLDVATNYAATYTASCNALYSDTFLSQPVLPFSAICATASLLWERTSLALTPHKHQWALSAHDPVASSLLSFLGPHLVGTNHCIPKTQYKTCNFHYVLTQSSSHHSSALVEVTYIRMTVPFFFYLENWLFICFLVLFICLIHY